MLQAWGQMANPLRAQAGLTMIDLKADHVVQHKGTMRLLDYESCRSDDFAMTVARWWRDVLENQSALLRRCHPRVVVASNHVTASFDSVAVEQLKELQEAWITMATDGHQDGRPEFRQLVWSAMAMQAARRLLTGTAQQPRLEYRTLCSLAYAWSQLGWCGVRLEER